MLDRNLKELEATGAACARAIREAGEDGELELFTSRSGAPSAALHVTDGQAKTLYSRFDPMKQAEREAAAFPGAPDGSTVAVLGLGLGFHLEILAANYPSLNFAVFEKRPALAREALRRADFTSLIRNGRLTLHAGLPPREAQEEAASLYSSAAAAPLFRHPALFDAEIEYYHPLLRALKGSGGNSLRVLSFTARGAALPHSLADCHDAFRELGHEVRVVDLTEITREQEKVDAARNSAIDFAPDLIFTIDVAGLVPHVHGRLGVPVVSWFFDNPLSFLEGRASGREAVVHYIEDLGENYFIFSWDNDYIPELKQRGARRAEYLPFATNPNIFKPVELTAEEREKYGCGVSFAGNSGPRDPAMYRRKAIAALRGIDVKVYGDEGWLDVADVRIENGKEKSFNTKAQRHKGEDEKAGEGRGNNIEYRGHIGNRAGLPLLYNASEININLTDKQSISSLPIRVFDIMACGGFLISDYREDLPRLFTAGKEVVCVSGPDDMRKAVEYYLARPEERRAIAEAGRARVLAEHTFRKRIAHILERVYQDEE